MTAIVKRPMLSFHGFLKKFLEGPYQSDAMNNKYKNINNTKIAFFKSTLFLWWLNVFNIPYAPALDTTSSMDKNWNFKVTLDGDEIGYHNFSIIHKDQHHEIYSSARFDVKFIFINVYSYKHENIEHWYKDCLSSINAMTDDNGDLYNVSGNANKEAFIVNTTKNDNKKQNKYLPCIKTFAYWDPDFLKENTLLNSQTGEIISVDSEFIGNETLKNNGKEVVARHYRLHGKDLRIDLWYSADDHWLALESLTESGHIVRYTMP